jgi:hypothetical protein
MWKKKRFTLEARVKKKCDAWVLVVHKPIILATQEEEIRRITV